MKGTYRATVSTHHDQCKRHDFVIYNAQTVRIGYRAGGVYRFDECSQRKRTFDVTKWQEKILFQSNRSYSLIPDGHRRR